MIGLPKVSTLRLSLLRLMIVASLAAFAVVASAVLVYEQTTFKPRAVMDLRQQSDTLAAVVLPPLEFSDLATVTQYLETRRRYPQIVAVGLYSATGQRVASYVRDADARMNWPITVPDKIAIPHVPVGQPTATERDNYEFVDGKLHVWHPVEAHGRAAGYLFMCADVPPLYARLPQYGIMAGAVLLALIAVAAILRSGLQRNFLTPVEQLTAVTEQVTQQKDYALRAPVLRGDELGRLAIGLNEMLSTVASRDHALRHSEARMRSIVETEPECVKIISQEGALVEINPAGLAMLEAESLTESRQQPLLHYVAEHFRDAFVAMHRRVMQGEPGALEFEAIGLRGTRRWLDTRAVPLRNPDGTIAGALAITRDVTERKVFERTLARRTEHQAAVLRLGLEALSVPSLEALFQRAADTVATALHADITAVFEVPTGSQSAQLRAGYGWGSDAVGNLQVPTQADLLAAPVLHERYGIVNSIGVAIRGVGRAWGILSAHSKRARAFADDDVDTLQEVANLLAQAIQRAAADTARAAVEAQLLQAQKMDALGRLAGGIAHDFNNLLSAILGNAQLALEDVGPAHPSVVSLEQIQNAGGRAKELVQRILTFSRQQAPRRERLSLQPIVEEVARLLRATIPAGVAVRVEVGVEVPMVFADSAQIHQTLLNLGTNAWQAIAGSGDGSGGRIELSLHSCDVNDELLQANPTLRPGKYACITVTDTGSGIDATLKQKIFDPFFTTKPLGEGTGLGLSVVLGIMQAHGGAVTVASEPNRGAKFGLYFPAAEAADAVGNRQTVVSTAADRGRGERILYLDDEEPLVFLATRLLERIGYRVDGFTKPELALAAFKAEPQAFRLIVTDLSMPGKSGMEVAREILALQPDAVVVLASGYLRQSDIDAALALGIREVVLKPNTVDELAPIVQRLLSTQSTVSFAAAGAAE